MDRLKSIEPVVMPDVTIHCNATIREVDGVRIITKLTATQMELNVDRLALPEDAKKITIKITR